MARGWSGPGASAAVFVLALAGCSPSAAGGGSGGAPAAGTGGRGGGSGGALTGGAAGASASSSGGAGLVAGSGGAAVAATGGAPSSAGGAGQGSGGLASGGSGSGSAGGGAAPDGGTADAGASGGTAGRAGAGGAGGCAALFCEDFEKGIIDPAIWDVKLNGQQPTPNVVTQAALVAHGRYAAHFHANPNLKSYDLMITKSAPAGLRGHHFGRAYFMITPMPPANHTQYIYAGTTGFPEYRYLEVASAGNNAWQVTYVDLVPPTTGEDYHAGGQVPLGKWFCLEWEFNDTPDQASVYVDGILDYAASAFTFGGATTGLVGGFAAFGFGYYAWHPATYPFDIYYDDIALDTKRVGCL